MNTAELDRAYHRPIMKKILTVLLLAPEAYWPIRRVGAEFHAAAEGTATFEAIHALLEEARVAPRETSLVAPRDVTRCPGQCNELVTPRLGANLLRS